MNEPDRRGWDSLLALARGVAGATVVLVRVAGSLGKRVIGTPIVRSTARILALASGLALLTVGVAATCFARIPHGSIGVKQVDFGDRGIAERDFPPGIAFRIPLVESSHFVDGRTKVLSFAWESEGGGAPVLDVRTRDGAVVKVGASVVYRARRGEAWRIVADGLKNVWHQRVRTAAEAMLAQGLGTLTASDLAATDARLKCADEIARKLDLALAAEHVEIERVLITQVWFGPVYEKNLQERQLGVQQERLQEAATAAEALRARIEIAVQEIENAARTIAAEWDRRIAERAAVGRSEIAAIRTETKFYDQTKRSAGKAGHDQLVMEGERILARSEALKDSLMRKALSTAGGRIWLARQAAENLNIRQVTLDSSDPRVPSVLDLDAMVKLLVGAQAAKSR